jgi:hypothetical protein
MAMYLDEFSQLGKPGGCTRGLCSVRCFLGLDVVVDVARGHTGWWPKFVTVMRLERYMHCGSMCLACRGENLAVPASFLRPCKDGKRNIPKVTEAGIIQGEHPTKFYVWQISPGLFMPEARCTR